jgi:hypothetical protein
MFIMIPAVLVFVMAFREKRSASENGVLPFQEGLKFGLMLTLFITLLTPITQSIISLVIAPEYFPNVMRYAVEKGMMSQSDAEGYFNLKNYIIQSSIGSVVSGAVSSAVLAFLASRSK